MSALSESLATVSAFVSGEISAPAFEQSLYRSPGMETLLSAERAPPYSQSGTTLFQHLIALDYADPGDVLEAQGVLAQLLGQAEMLSQRGATATPPITPHSEYRLILSAQPKWLDADATYLSHLLASAPELSHKERLAWLRRRILELFRYVKRPPRWLQSPSWPVGDSGPLVFLGQFTVDDYFHDTAAIYIFHDPGTGECKSIVQIA